AILPLPVADRIRAGVERRLAQLSPDERTAALIAAAAGAEARSGPVEEALAGSGLGLAALDAAAGAGLLRLGARRIPLPHPAPPRRARSSARRIGRSPSWPWSAPPSGPGIWRRPRRASTRPRRTPSRPSGPTPWPVARRARRCAPSIGPPP